MLMAPLHPMESALPLQPWTWRAGPSCCTCPTKATSVYTKSTCKVRLPAARRAALSRALASGSSCTAAPMLGRLSRRPCMERPGRRTVDPHATLLRPGMPAGVAPASSVLASRNTSIPGSPVWPTVSEQARGGAAPACQLAHQVACGAAAGTAWQCPLKHRARAPACDMPVPDALACRASRARACPRCRSTAAAGTAWPLRTLWCTPSSHPAQQAPPTSPCS